MKKSIILFSAITLISSTMIAQTPSDKQGATKTAVNANPQAANHGAAVQSPSSQQNADLSMKFKNEEHSFGNMPEGPSVSYDFEFTNISKEPIVLSNVQASCGCTTPTWPKEPIAPGKSGKIDVVFNSEGKLPAGPTFDVPPCGVVVVVPVGGVSSFLSSSTSVTITSSPFDCL
jgi:hypothetical protein